MPQGDGSLLIRDANIFWLNFRGAEGQYNREGDRNFCLGLDPDTAAQLTRDGWLIKETKVRDEGDEPTPYVQVSVKWGKKHQPRIFLVTTREGVRVRRTLIDEDMVDLLDTVEIANVDLIVQPSRWENNGKSGIKAYLKSLYLTIVEDELEAEYSVLDDLPKVDED